MLRALPPEFAGQLAALLGDELTDFLATFEAPRVRGLRFDPTKVTGDELTDLLGWPLEPVPWCTEARFLVNAPASGSGPTSTPGRHPAHLAGLFYLQEPAAAAAVAALDPAPGSRVVDLCAAPGGKTTQLASLVGPSGLVVANEVVGGRLRALHDNLDRWGAANVVTTSMALDRLAPLGDGFDGVLLDAPCSGEALFRRDRSACDHWSPAAVAGAARRQDELLEAAAQLLGPGGVLVYSTCTFNRTENEDRVAALVDRSPGWELDDLSHLGASPGLLVPGSNAHTARTARLWPHRHQGEGQFVARLRRTGTPAPGPGWELDDPDRDLGPDLGGARGRDLGPGRSRGLGGGRGRGRGRDGARRTGGRSPDGSDAGGPVSPALLAAWDQFRRQSLPGFEPDPVRLVERKGWLFARPPAAGALVPGALAGVQRPGLPLGRARPGRFEPHPGLATALTPDQVAEAVSWVDDQVQLHAYLRGETVDHPGPDGWVVVCYHRWPLGWARRSRGVLKNAFPPYLRRQAAGVAPRV